MTRSQSRAHFFRHENGRSQTGQTLLGRSALAVRFGTGAAKGVQAGAGLIRRGGHLTLPGFPQTGITPDGRQPPTAPDAHQTAGEAMKAEDRHELQQNELEEYTDKLKPFLKEYGRTLALVAVAGVLLLIALSVYVNNSRAGSEAGWGEYFAANSAVDFENVAELEAGTNAAVWARLTAGEVFLDDANTAAFTDRDKADDDLESARENFQFVLDDPDAPPAATAKALFGMAAVEEATGAGDLSAAKARLTTLVTDYASSPLVPLAEARLKALEDPATGPFLAWLDTQDPTPEDFARPLDGAPPEPGPALPSRPEGLRAIGDAPAADEPAADPEEPADIEDGDDAPEPVADAEVTADGE